MTFVVDILEYKDLVHPSFDEQREFDTEQEAEEFIKEFNQDIGSGYCFFKAVGPFPKQ